MPPTIHLVRHAQGVHNLSVENESIHDPDLTPLGESQCAALRASFPRQRITRLVASPLRRTVNTCLLSFGEPDLLPVVALDCLQEVSDQPCDTGSSKDALAAEFGDALDLSRVSDAWTDKANGPFEPTLEKLSARGREARRALREIAAGDDDAHVVAVSHGGILHFVTDDWQGIPEGRGELNLRSMQMRPLLTDDSHRLGQLRGPLVPVCRPDGPGRGRRARRDRGEPSPFHVQGAHQRREAPDARGGAAAHDSVSEN